MLNNDMEECGIIDLIDVEGLRGVLLNLHHLLAENKSLS